MSQTNGQHASKSVQLVYQLIRNTTSPDEIETGVRSYVVNLPAQEILKLDTEDNLRAYIPEHNPKRRTRVHDAIRDTILEYPQRFITRNSGFAITAHDAEVNDKEKTISLVNPSIINGAQSQGEIRRWFSELVQDPNNQLPEEPPFHVRAQIIVEPDEAQVVETAIARNTATPVKSISQAGARGHLEELEKSILAVKPGFKIRKSETDENVYDTRKILQYTRLLMPPSVSEKDSSAEVLRPYKNPEQCLTDFSTWFDIKSSDEEANRKYNFTVQMAPIAIDEYHFWETHPAWNGQRIWQDPKKGGRAVRRDQQGKVIWVSPGLIFPILGALSEFVVEKSQGNWDLIKPKQFKDTEMVARAVAQFRALDSDPMQMGRSAGAYDALRIYPSTIVEVIKDMADSNQ
jgi:hypothetical protein